MKNLVHSSRPIRAAKLICLGLAALFVTAACTPPVADEFFAVDSTADTIDANVGDGICSDAAGNCTLRAAVMEGNADPNSTEIQLVGGQTYLLSLTGAGEDASATGDLDLLERTYIRGDGTALASVQGVSDRVIDVRSGSFHFLEGLKITGGDTFGNGGGIRNADTLVGIEDSHIVSNVASISGGGISNAGTLFIEDSTISANAALIDFGGGIFTTGYTRLFQVTVASNYADNTNADISTDTGAELHVIQSTLTGDEYALDLWRGDVYFTNSVVTGTTSCLIAIGSVTSSGGNIESDVSCGLTDATDLQNTDPNLMILAGNGGLIPTRVPVAGGNAYDHTTCATGLDARGIGFPRPQGAGCDAGAVERPFPED